MPCRPPFGTLPSEISLVFGSMFQTSQCVNKPTGASGSSTIKARLFASAGVPKTLNATGATQVLSRDRNGGPRNGDSDDLSGGPQQIGPYHILQKLGEGH